MNETEVVEFDEEDDPELLPDDLKAIWLWLDEQGMDAADKSLAARKAGEMDKGDFFSDQLMTICVLMGRLFDTADDRANQARKDANAKLERWEQAVQP